jgi:hypothetical protein
MYQNLHEEDIKVLQDYLIPRALISFRGETFIKNENLIFLEIIVCARNCSIQAKSQAKEPTSAFPARATRR